MILAASPIGEPTFLDAAEVRAAVHLVDVLERDGVKLVGSGKQRMGLCPLHGERTPSFSVDTERGVFNCFGCGRGGDVFSYVQARDGCDFGAALGWLASFAGIKPGLPPAIIQPRPAPPLPPPFVPVPMPPEVAQAWANAVERLRRRKLSRMELADWRGWPFWAVDELSAAGMIGEAEYHGRRGWAFPVECPIPGEGGKLLQIGFHMRISKADGWRFIPNETEHGRRTPALPFVMGDIASAEVVAITEGQWDAVSAALALGWFGKGKPWPRGRAVVGIRGKNGLKPFLEQWGPLWPRKCTALVFPDSDPTGVPWRGPGGFRDLLVGMSGRVVDVATVNGKKDLNDATRIS